MPRWYENTTDLIDLGEFECLYIYEAGDNHDIIIEFIAIIFDHTKAYDLEKVHNVISLN